ncbi:NADAR family protein [Salinactinospora qingdaonensis]|uniref:NADAR family protein n=1 Tax=Salinactinospora qingdaonensis TaxID=702744 RepID=A0ABP7FY11_9ACTN
MVEPSPLSLPELRDRTERGESFAFLFFWGHRPLRDGSIGPGCLSQWWPAPFTVGGVTYATAQHWMMAQKARLFGDDVTARHITAATHPGEAKALGRKVRGFDEQVWCEHRFDIVARGSVEKFGQHPELADFLLGTRRRILAEANPHDLVWGIGVTAKDERATDPTRWPGLNLLGFALMHAREQLSP